MHAQAHDAQDLAGCEVVWSQKLMQYGLWAYVKGLASPVQAQEGEGLQHPQLLVVLVLLKSSRRQLGGSLVQFGAMRYAVCQGQQCIAATSRQQRSGCVVLRLQPEPGRNESLHTFGFFASRAS